MTIQEWVEMVLAQAPELTPEQAEVIRAALN